MGTRSTIRLPGAEKGRYVHWDGYPSGVGRAIWTIVHRDGLATARKTLVEDHPGGWSSLDASQVVNTPKEIAAAKAKGPGYFPAPDDVRGYHAWQFKNRTEMAQVEGCGLAYTDDDEGWSTGEEWNYTLADDALIIDGYTTHRIAWDGPEPDWQKMEE